MSAFDERDLPGEDEGEGLRGHRRGDDVEGHVNTGEELRGHRRGDEDEGEGLRGHRRGADDDDDVEGHMRGHH